MSEFERWKTKTVAKLAEIQRRNEGNRKIAQDVRAILNALEYARPQDLHRVLILLHHAADDDPEFLQLIPSEDEVERMLQGV